MPSFISQESIDEISNRVEIEAIVNEYVPLVQKNSDWWGCCPFHHEKTASFSVSPDKKFYYCFGCQAKGNVFNFIQKMENLSFPESIEFLAKKVGVKIIYKNESNDNQSPEKSESSKLKEEYINLYNRVSTSFHYFLLESDMGKFAFDYITKRGITKETLEKFKIGYSPADKKWLKKFLLSKNYSEEFLAKSGLFSENYKDYSFFSDRLMFPIFDRYGNVVAFGGRFLRGDSSKSPKYLNSKDLIQYKKGYTLYAFNFAKNAIRENKKVIFCEGYMDCIAYHQSGINYAVAPLGTALTENQIRLVKSFVDYIYLSFDSDNAGQNATIKAIKLCRKENVPVKVIRLKDGKDPAEIMQSFGYEYLTNEVNNAILDDEFLLSKLRELYPKDSIDGKLKASLEFFAYIDCLQSDVQKDACLDIFCQEYGINKEAAKKDYYNRSNISNRYRTEITKQESEKVEVFKPTAELRAVITAVTDDVSLFEQMRNEISIDDLSDSNAKKLFSVLEDCLKSNCFSVSNILNRFRNEIFVDFLIKSINEFEGHNKESVKDSILLLKKSSLIRRRDLLQEQISKISNSSLQEDKNKLYAFIKEKIELDSKIEKIKDCYD